MSEAVDTNARAHSPREDLGSDPERTYELDRKHVFHSWSAQDTLNPMVIVRGEGSRIWDQTGQSYLDFTSQLVFTNLGHQHPRLVAAIQQQAADLCTVAPQHANGARSEAARLIAEQTPTGLDKIFFTNGGADANEHAVRMARLHTGRHKVLTTYRSYHGGTQLAVNMTGDPRRWSNDHASSGTIHFMGPFLYRSAFHAATQEEECERALEHLAQVVAFEGPETIAAIVLEAIPGTAGIMVPPPGYLSGVRALCDQHGIMFIADEVMSGFGRAGKWFAVELDDAVPDLLTFAKGVNSGYVPMGGVAISQEVAQTFGTRTYPGGLTYSGHPLACAAAIASIRTLQDDKIVEHADELGRDVFAPALQKLRDRHTWVGEVRGVGAFWAIEFVKDQETKEPLAPYGGSSPEMTAIVAACKERGLLPFVNYNRIHLVPPLNTSAALAHEAIQILDESITVVENT